eukprot:GFKZ01013308.1.p1 GENE.GFKZ01013308.1~~GFKZ01013308.1.p1  ORF type:complete len:125 (-),score=18.61 GFKZ01013308.1:250-624(-)
MNPNGLLFNSSLENRPLQHPLMTDQLVEDRLALLIRTSFTALGCRVEDRQRNRRRPNKKMATAALRTRRRQGGKAIFATLDRFVNNVPPPEPVSSGEESRDGSVVGDGAKERISRGDSNMRDMN